MRVIVRGQKCEHVDVTVDAYEAAKQIAGEILRARDMSLDQWLDGDVLCEHEESYHGTPVTIRLRSVSEEDKVAFRTAKLFVEMARKL